MPQRLGFHLGKEKTHGPQSGRRETTEQLVMGGRAAGGSREWGPRPEAQRDALLGPGTSLRPPPAPRSHPSCANPILLPYSPLKSLGPKAGSLGCESG